MSEFISLYIREFNNKTLHFWYFKGASINLRPFFTLEGNYEFKIVQRTNNSRNDIDYIVLVGIKKHSRIITSANVEMYVSAIGQRVLLGIHKKTVVVVFMAVVPRRCAYFLPARRIQSHSFFHRFSGHFCPNYRPCRSVHKAAVVLSRDRCAISVRTPHRAMRTRRYRCDADARDHGSIVEVARDSGPRDQRRVSRLFSS